MTDFLTTGAVAALLGVPRWRLAYLIERGELTGPSVQVPGRRLFTADDVGRLRQALASRNAAAGGVRKPGDASDDGPRPGDPTPSVRGRRP